MEKTWKYSRDTFNTLNRILYLKILQIVPKLYLHPSHHDILASSLKEGIANLWGLDWTILLEFNVSSLIRKYHVHWEQKMNGTLYRIISWKRLKPKFPHSTVKWNFMETQDVRERTWILCTLHMFRDFNNYLWLWLRGESCFYFLKECTK